MDIGGGSAAKRARKAYSYTTPKRHAIMLNRIDNKKFPRKLYGTAHILRGSQGGDPRLLDKYGPSWKDASPEQRAERNATGWRGQGKYSFGKSLRALGGYTKSVGNIARSVGGIARRGAMDYAAVMGQGLYGGQGSYTRNSLIEGGAPSLQMHAQHDETDDITFSMEEYIKPIYAPNIAANTTSSFNSQIVEVNPGLTTFAPKMAAIAANFTHYEIHQLIFTFKSKINESNVNNGISGDIMMTFNYDPANDSYDSVSDVMQSSGRAMARIVDSIELGVECEGGKSKDTKYFVRTCPVPIGRDVDEYDHGSLLIATNNIPSTYSNTAIGDLYVYYKVTVKQFKPGASKINSQQRDLFVNTADVQESAGFRDSTNLPTQINRSTLRAQQSNIGGEVSTTQANQLTYTFPADVEGFFELHFIVEGTSMTIGNIVSSLLGNVSFVADIYAAGIQNTDSPAANYFVASGGRAVYVAHLKVRASTTGLVNNSVTITLTDNDTGTWAGWSLDVKELSQNCWQSRKIVEPKFVNVTSGLESAP